MAFPTDVIPFPADPYEMLHYNMVRAHSTFKRGYDSILPRLDNPPTNDLPNFLGYCEAWAESINHHHTSEEIVVFPFLNQKLDFSHEIEQHKVIHAGVDEVIASIRAAKADPTKFDPSHVKDLMQKLREPLFQHLDEEVEHIAPEKLKVFEVKSLLELNEELEKYAKGNGNPFLVIPFIVSHTPPEYKNIWPPLPWALRKVVIPYVFAVRYYGYWKYSPYAMS